MARGAAGAPGLLLLEALGLVLLCLGLTTWFAARPAVLATGACWSALLLVAGARWWLGGRRLPGRPRPETVACLSLAAAYRLPALLHPWGWVNKDGAYGGFVALHLLQGQRPAPVFTEGANYQGTLKAHLAAGIARLTGVDDLSWLMTAASALLSLAFLVATMALARRVGGRGAALAAGLYLALGPRFPTVFALNCVGQYVEVLALGGLALALVAKLLDTQLAGAPARLGYLAIGLALGGAFWQQPVALAYVIAAIAALALRRATWRDAWVLAVPVGLAVGALPVLLWNARHGWASWEIVGRDPAELAGQAEALGVLVWRTLTISFPILAGLSPRHPWAGWPLARWMAAALIPAGLVGFAALRARDIRVSLAGARPSPAVLPLLLAVSCLGLFWSVAAGAVYARPRYLLPVVAATAVHLGVCAAWLWSRWRWPALALGALALGLNLAGTLPRFREGAALATYYREIVDSLEALGIRTGYADFSIAAPVTMFTAERITLSARLGPTPAYYSESQERRVEELGPDAFVLRPRDDAGRFAATLHGLGVGYRFVERPLPVFYGLSRGVRVEEVAGAVAGEDPAAPE